MTRDHYYSNELIVDDEICFSIQEKAAWYKDSSDPLLNENTIILINQKTLSVEYVIKNKEGDNK